MAQTLDRFPVSDETNLCDEHQKEFGWTTAYILDRWPTDRNTTAALMAELLAELARTRAACLKQCGRAEL